MILDKIVEKKLERINERKKDVSEEVLYREAIRISQNKKTNFFKKHLEEPSFSIIGEFKRASPSKGIILDDFDLDKILEFYEKIGVDSYSILTEEEFFLGNDKYLEYLARKALKPTLRKDFIIDFYQIYESKVLGADGILLICSLLKNNLPKFYNEAKRVGLEPLVEIHNREELEIALESNCEIIGINNRNLTNFKTSLKITEDIIKYIPKDKVIISESGIKNINDLRYLKDIGVNGALIGEAFMRNIENESFIKAYMEFRNG